MILKIRAWLERYRILRSYYLASLPAPQNRVLTESVILPHGETILADGRLFIAMGRPTSRQRRSLAARLGRLFGRRG